MNPEQLRARRRWYETHRLASGTVTLPLWRRALAAVVDLVPRRTRRNPMMRPQPKHGGPGGPAGVREPRRPRPTAPQAGAAPLPSDNERD